MDGVIQISIKIIISVLTISMLFKLWKMDIDLHALGKLAFDKMQSMTSISLPERETNKLYQFGKIVAEIDTFTHSLDKTSICFNEVFKAKNIDLSKEFEFQKFRLIFIRAKSLSLFSSDRPLDSPIYTTFESRIIGER